MSESDEIYNHEKDDINHNKLVIGEGKKRKKKSSKKSKSKSKKLRKKRVIVNNAPHSDYTNIPNPKQNRKKNKFDGSQLHELKEELMRTKYGQSVKQALQASQVPPEVLAQQVAQRQLVATQPLTGAPAQETSVSKRLQIDQMEELVSQLKDTKKEMLKKTKKSVGREFPKSVNDVIRRADHRLKAVMHKFDEDPDESEEMLKDAVLQLNSDWDELLVLRSEQAEHGTLPSSKKLAHSSDLAHSASVFESGDPEARCTTTNCFLS